MDQTGFIKALLLNELPDNQSVEVEVNNKSLILHRRGGQVYATDIYCPHADVRLDPRNTSGDLILCKAHGYRSNIKTGECLEETNIRLGTFPTMVEDGTVWIKL